MDRLIERDRGQLTGINMYRKTLSEAIWRGARRQTNMERGQWKGRDK